jgi:hypothetical protein
MRNVIWLCDHKQCHAVARRFFAMSAEQFDEYELGATLEAGRSAGGYLDEIGPISRCSARRNGHHHSEEEE